MPIVFRDVGFSYPHGQPVLSDISLTIEAGETVAITGPSGSGKTTLLQLIGGLLVPSHGVIDGGQPLGEIRWVFQTPTVLGRRSVLDNVLMGLHQQRREYGDSVAEARLAVNQVGLDSLERRIAGSLSGGELQRTQIARALVGAPPLVLADEPTGQLDSTNTERVIGALLSVRRPESTLVMATHDLTVAEACRRQFHIQDGRIHDETL